MILERWLLPDKMRYGLSTGCWGQHQRRTATTEYIALDVSMKESAISIRRAGKRIWRGKWASAPTVIAELYASKTQCHLLRRSGSTDCLFGGRCIVVSK